MCFLYTRLHIRKPPSFQAIYSSHLEVFPALPHHTTCKSIIIDYYYLPGFRDITNLSSFTFLLQWLPINSVAKRPWKFDHINWSIFKDVLTQFAQFLNFQNAGWCNFKKSFNFKIISTYNINNEKIKITGWSDHSKIIDWGSYRLGFHNICYRSKLNSFVS